MNLAGIIGQDYSPEFNQDRSRFQRTPQDESSISQQYRQNNPQGPSPLELGDVSSGLEVVDGVTEDFYNDLSNLRSFVSTMYRNYNIDVSKPDLTNEEAVKAHQLYLKASSSLMHRANNLKNSQKMLEKFNNLKQQGAARLAGGSQQIGSQPFSQLSSQGMGVNRNELGEIASVFARKDLYGEELVQAKQKYQEVISEYSQRIEEAESRGDLAEAERLSEVIMNLPEPAEGDRTKWKIEQQNANTRSIEAETAKQNADIKGKGEARRAIAQRMSNIVGRIEEGALNDPENRPAIFGAYYNVMKQLTDAYKNAEGEEKDFYKAQIDSATLPVASEWTKKEQAEIDKLLADANLNNAKAESERAETARAKIGSLPANNFGKKIIDLFDGRVDTDENGKLTSKDLIGKKIGKKVIDRAEFSPSDGSVNITFEDGSTPDNYTRDEVGTLLRSLASVSSNNINQEDIELVIDQIDGYEWNTDIEGFGVYIDSGDENLIANNFINPLSTKAKYASRSDFPSIRFKSPVNIRLEEGSDKTTLVHGIRIKGNKSSNIYEIFGLDQEGRETSIRTIQGVRNKETVQEATKEWFKNSGIPIEIAKLNFLDDYKGFIIPPKYEEKRSNTEKSDDFQNQTFIYGEASMSYDEIVELVNKGSAVKGLINDKNNNINTVDDVIKYYIENGKISAVKK